MPTRFQDETPIVQGDDDRRYVRQRHHYGGGYGWGAGAALILLGGIFLLRNLNIFSLPNNWWALFILIPAVTSASVAWTYYREAGNRFTPSAAGAAIGSVVLTFVSGMFLFGANWSVLWPVFLILAGIAALIGRDGRGSRQRR